MVQVVRPAADDAYARLVLSRGRGRLREYVDQLLNKKLLAQHIGSKRNVVALRRLGVRRWWDADTSIADEDVE